MLVECSTRGFSSHKLEENFLGVLETLVDFGIGSDKLIGQVVGLSLSLLISIGNVALIRSEKNFRVVVKDDLHGIVAEPEKDCMLGSNPFLQVYHILLFIVCRRRWHNGFEFIGFLLLVNQIVSKMLQQSNLLLKNIRVFDKAVRRNHWFATTRRFH